MSHPLLRTFFVFVFLVVEAAQADETRWQDPVDVEFTARCDGSKQRYVLMLPKAFDAAKERDLMIALHGHGSDRWQFVNNDRDECRAVRDAAAAHGMLFLSPDYRAKTSWMGPAAEADWRESRSSSPPSASRMSSTARRATTASAVASRTSRE